MAYGGGRESALARGGGLVEKMPLLPVLPALLSDQLRFERGVRGERDAARASINRRGFRRGMEGAGAAAAAAAAAAASSAAGSGESASSSCTPSGTGGTWFSLIGVSTVACRGGTSMSSSLRRRGQVEASTVEARRSVTGLV